VEAKKSGISKEAKKDFGVRLLVTVVKRGDIGRVDESV
jgi:hypothetical protein